MKFNATKEQTESLIYGGAIGDAYGAPYEFSHKRGSFKPKWTSSIETHGGLIGKQPVGTWTDDTSMTIATIANIYHNHGTVSMKSLLSTYTKWVKQGMYTIDGVCDDCGTTTIKAITQGYGCTDVNDNGNGSLMRISPLALTDATDDEIHDVSASTHAHMLSVNACIQWVHIIRELLSGAWIDEAIITSNEYMHDNNLKPSSNRLVGIWELDESEIKSSGFVVDSLEAAAWALSTSSSYEETVNRAVSLGGDTDTIACIAGSAAGVVYGRGGLKGINVKYIHELRGSQLIDKAINQIESL